MNDYVWLYRPGHPNASKSGSIREHVFVMSEMLGRPLVALEVVHHVDENRANNAPNNLQLFPSKAEHNRHHTHLRAMHACGNPNYMLCAVCKKYDDPANMRMYSNQYSAYHPSCAATKSACRLATPEGKAKAKALNDIRKTPEGKVKANAATAKSRAKRKLSQ